TQPGLALLVTLASNSRDLTSITLSFAIQPLVKVSCGTATGCTVAGTTLTFDLKSIASAWYTSDVTYGGSVTLRIPLVFDRSVTGLINIQLSNSRGTSAFSGVLLP